MPSRFLTTSCGKRLIEFCQDICKPIYLEKVSTFHFVFRKLWLNNFCCQLTGNVFILFPQKLNLFGLCNLPGELLSHHQHVFNFAFLQQRSFLHFFEVGQVMCCIFSLHLYCTMEPTVRKSWIKYRD